jgi:hypothetical protein
MESTVATGIAMRTGIPSGPMIFMPPDSSAIESGDPVCSEFKAQIRIT